MDNIELTIKNEALNEIAKLAVLRKTGARGLRSVIENILLDTMFEIPGTPDVTEVVISGDVVEGKSQPLYIYGEKEKKNEKKIVN